MGTLGSLASTLMLAALLFGCRMAPTTTVDGSPTTRVEPPPTAAATVTFVTQEADPTPGSMGLGDTAAETEMPGVTPAPAGSPFQRKDVPPGSLDSQLALYNPAGTTLQCVLGESGGRAQADAENCKLHVADILSLVFGDFAPEAEVSLDITAPDGSVEHYRVPAAKEELQHPVLPGQPRGVYRIGASDGSRTLTGAFTVDSASAPTITAWPDTIRPGEMLQILLAGFQLHQHVEVHLYRSHGLLLNIGTGQSIFDYAAALGTVDMDGQGEAIKTVQSTPDEPWGGYAIETNPPVKRQHPLEGTFRISAMEGNLLDRQDTPPPGVSSQLPYAPSEQGCLGERLRPGAHMLIGAVETASTFTICIEGFAGGKEIQAEITRADPTMPAPMVLSRQSGRITVATGAFDAPGISSVTIKQGGSTAEASFTLAPAARPQVMVAAINGYPPNQIELAGFRSNQRVALHLYRRAEAATCGGDSCWSYATTVPAIMVDEHGRAIYSIGVNTVADNEYLVVADGGPLARAQTQFEVLSPDTSGRAAGCTVACGTHFGGR